MAQRPVTRSRRAASGVAGALRKLSANDENKREVASLGGIEMLIRSSEIHLDNAVVQAGVAGAAHGGSGWRRTRTPVCVCVWFRVCLGAAAVLRRLAQPHRV